MAVLVLQFSSHCTIGDVLRLRPEREFICLSLDKSDTPESFVADASILLVYSQFQRMPLSLVEQVGGDEFRLHVTQLLPEVRVAGVVFERTVADQLSIEATIASMIDFLVEDAIMEGTDQWASLSRGELEGNLRESRGGEDTQHEQQKVTFDCLGCFHVLISF